MGTTTLLECFACSRRIRWLPRPLRLRRPFQPIRCYPETAAPHWQCTYGDGQGWVVHCWELDEWIYVMYSTLIVSPFWHLCVAPLPWMAETKVPIFSSCFWQCWSHPEVRENKDPLLFVVTAAQIIMIFFWFRHSHYRWLTSPPGCSLLFWCDLTASSVTSLSDSLLLFLSFSLQSLASTVTRNQSALRGTQPWVTTAPR